MLAVALVDAAEPRSGGFSLKRTLAEVVGEDTARNAERIIAPDEPITWEVFVPEGYDPDRPAGLMVYISPTRSGKIPRGWKDVMERRNMIWVAANKSGNRVLVPRRVVYAIVAPTLIRADYNIDPERIYLSGLSGGGKMASMVATDHAHLFKGAIYNCGVDFWDKHPPKRYEQIKQNHYVFVTGTLDQALEPTKKVFGQYRDAGIENSLLMVIPEMTHKNPNSYDFDEAIGYLDSRLDAAAGSESDSLGQIHD